MEYKIVAEKYSNETLVKALIYIAYSDQFETIKEIDELTDELLDKYVSFGYDFWGENSENITPTEIGWAIDEMICKYSDGEEIDFEDIENNMHQFISLVREERY
jgi:hypothetical protein